MLVPLIKTMRPKQWSKNIFVLAALIFDVKLFAPHFLFKSLLAVGAFLCHQQRCVSCERCG